MINLKFNEIYLLDLREDILLNVVPMYDFLSYDIEKAFWFGYLIHDTFKELKELQPFLYSKPLRHIAEEISSYEKQIEFWDAKRGEFNLEEDPLQEVLSLYEYILNNLFYDNKDDIIKIAIKFGQNLKNVIKEKENEKETEKLTNTSKGNISNREESGS